ncbi:MAG: hypothetical protein CME70_09350 [Halobacteriovorax sp.]|nr:hypothetical protein [Halobacteriovorax sp.]|tara:strand:- start:199092 stop:200237 length:1146 start_codon:yes stop_codon:yes gene_type:complete
MFEDLIEKLKASIEELRKKLPGGGGDDDEYEDDDDYEEKYHDDGDEDDEGKTVKVQIKDLLQEGGESEDEEAGPKEKTKKIYTDEDDEDEDDEEDEDADAAAQKRKKIIIYAVAVLLIGFLLKDEFMPPEPDPVAVPVVKPKKRKRKKRKKPKKVVEAPAQEKPAEKPAEAVPEAEAPKPVVDVPPETAVGLPEENKPEPTAAPVVEAPKEETPAEPVEAPAVEEPKATESEAATEVTEVSKPAEDTGLDIQLGEETAPKVEEKPAVDMASKIEKKLEYVAPPNYERSGRGLIYNCVGKHWACVDKFSYLTCKENTKWSGQNAKKPECVIKNVYASVEDCSIIQKHYIESSEPTGFCDNIPGVESKEVAEEVSEEVDLLGE